MQSRLSFVKEKGREIPFIDLSGWKSLEERVSTSSQNSVQSAIEKSFLDVALQLYKRNSTYQDTANRNSSNEYQATQDFSDSNTYQPFDFPRVTYLPPESRVSSSYCFESQIGSYQIPRTISRTLEFYSRPVLKENLAYNKSQNNKTPEYAGTIQQTGKSYALPENACCEGEFCFGYC